MNFLLKIVEGPNKGAEIALVEGVAVTLGKEDDCDIVLADATLPDKPLVIEASDSGVTVDGEPVEQFFVKTVGATSFAVGPADAPWGELKWERGTGNEEPAAGNGERESAEKREKADERQEKEEAPSASGPESDGGDGSKRRRGGCIGCVAMLVLLVLLLGALAWLFRATVRPYAEKALAYARESLHFGSGADGAYTAAARPMALSEVASRHGLELVESDGRAKLSGNLKTRAERLCATAEAYEAKPGVELDLSDDESFRTAAEDALFTLTEGELEVVSATNRVLSIRGTARSPEALKATLAALGNDLQKVRKVDAAGVGFGPAHRRDATGAGRELEPTGVSRAPGLAPRKSALPSLPVCGILTKPYPCLVMRDGTRVLEGAALGGGVIVRIDADAVTVTNSTGRFTWKP